MYYFKQRLRRAIFTVILSGITLVGLSIGSGWAQAQSYSPVIAFPAACGTCTMHASDKVTDVGWTLNMQGDGNLVMRNASGKACFASNTNGHNNAYVIYQSDGNFVVYASGGSPVLWASNTNGKWIGPAYSVSIHNGQFYVGLTSIHGPC